MPEDKPSIKLPPPAPPLPPAPDFSDFLAQQKVGITLKQLEELAKHPQSTQLPENPFSTETSDVYEKELPEYEMHYTQVVAYDKTHPGNAKTDFLKPGNVNIGWKLHLNVEPKNVRAVSKYFIANGYKHKYLSGGEIEDGKIFTVYIGSKIKTDQLAQQISKDLITFLARPTDHREIEFAPGIVGRFVDLQARKPRNLQEFDLYGEDGIVFLRSYFVQFVDYAAEQKPVPPALIQEAVHRSFQRLSEKYGEYFTG